MFSLKILLRSHLKRSVLFLSIFFLCCTCNKTEKQAPSDPWLEKFLKDVMLDENGIYTLFGSKPMVIFPVFCYSKEDYQQLYDSMSEEEKRNAIIIQDEDDHYDLPENWEKWEKFQAQFLSKRYVMVKQPVPDLPKEFTICFADLARVALCLEEHYDIFKRITHEEFDPLQESLSLKEGSPFWDKAFNSSILSGILFGFGEQNSFFFHWKAEESFPLNRRFIHNNKLRFDQTIDNFGIPIFATFTDLEDPVIEKYKKEREQIKALYKDKDFLETTLKQLCP